MSRLCPVRIFLLLAPFLYVAYALITPPFQNFDENQHLYRAWQLGTGQLVGERRGHQSGGELPPGLGQATLREIGSVVPQGPREIHRRPLSEMFAANTPIGGGAPPLYYDFYGAVVYSPAGYLPQIAAVGIGEAAGLSVEWTMRIGRLFNVALCILLVLWAIKLLPYGRWPMAIVALSPPMAAGAASFGQDALVNGAGLLLTALGLRIAAEGRWTGARAAATAVAGVAIALAKFVYLPLVALAAFPLPRSTRRRSWLLPPVAIGAVAAALMIGWMRIAAPAIVPTIRPWVPPVPEQVAWVLAHPLDFAVLVGRTYLVELPTAWAGLYAFGDSTVPVIWSAAVPGTAALLAAMAYGDAGAADLTRGRRLWMLLIFAAVALLVATVMFVALATRNSLIILGIQPRYFLPALPLAAIALMRRGEVGPPVMTRIAILLVLASHAAALGAILATFYTL